MKRFEKFTKHTASEEKEQRETTLSKDTFLQDAETRIQYLTDSGFEQESIIYEKVVAFAETIKSVGGQALLVGGSVRDEMVGVPCKDYDIEVHGVEPTLLMNLMKDFGKMKEVGTSFGILKMQVDGFEIDVSLPRRESSTGKGHKDFAVGTDPHMGIEEASARRDFTFNSLCKDVLTGYVYDYFGGKEDLEQKKLCITDIERFREDPLRVLRGVQFVGRFGLYVDDDTSKVMREMRADLEHLPKERIWEEWKKLFLRSKKPSLGLNAAMEIGIFHHMHPEVVELPNTPQDLKWHPEGDVWIHTLMVVDEMAKIVEQEHIDEEDAEVLFLAAFCHDFGKPITTEIIDGSVRARGHEPAGVDPAEKFLYQIGMKASTRTKVKNLVANHLAPSMMYVQEIQRGQKITDGAIKRLAKRIEPATITQLIHLAKADALGRGPFVDPEFPERSFMPSEYPAGEWLLERCRAIGVQDAPPKPVLFGRDLVALGFKPGPQFGKVLQHAEEMHIAGQTREEILSAIDRERFRCKEETGESPTLTQVLEALKQVS